MADLTDLQSAQTVKIVGTDLLGGETNPLAVDGNQSAQTTVRDPSSGAGVTTTLVGAKQSLDVNVTQTQPQSDKLGTGTIVALNGTYAVNTQGCAVVTFDITGTWVATLVIEGTVDGTTWTAISGWSRQTGLGVASTTSNVLVSVMCSSLAQVRIRASLFTSGTVAIASDAATPDWDPLVNVLANNNTTAALQNLLMGGKSQDGIQIPLQVDDQGRLVTSAITGFGAEFAFGDVSTAATTRVPVRRTAYNEQTVDGQRQLVSSSALDTAAGTGARSVQLEYYDQTGAGPFFETITLNGTTPVNTVNTNICFIEHIRVVTVGATGANAGTITLRTLALATIGTIAPNNNQTFWAHHYVPVGKVCNITGMSCGGSATVVGGGALFEITSRPIGVANVPELQISDFVRLYGQSSTFSRTYLSPIKVTGPARLTVYVTPEPSSAVTYRAAIDFFEP